MASRSAGLRRNGRDPGRVGRYAVGSLANSVTPGGFGGAVRIALFSRKLDCPERIWTATGVATTIGIARIPALAVLVVAAAAIAGFPLWPLLVMSGVMAGRVRPRA